MLARFAPWLFVLLWSTGFIGARLGLPHAEPLSFLSVRYALVLSLLLPLALAMRAPWPRDARQWLHIGTAGLLLHGIYLGGVFVAIRHGLPAGITALVVGMQPLLTAFSAALLLGEAVTRRQWLGLVLGLAGIALVVSGKVGGGSPLQALWPAVVALLGITAGTLYQKRFCPRFDLRSGAVVQFLPTAVATALVASAVEDFHIEWTGEFVFALAWLVLALSVGAIALLNFLIRAGSAVNVASLFYLTPPTTALLAWLIFGETLTAPMVAGMALAVGGVYLSRR
ncbi:DMT family transporter [Sulfurisoma sediminicola]|uniref:Drug/metabolite transporter (DMT)-like permease n=1 Tax=Sulfurisoma sediminicola TaxID=1381557 RepID=A0A497XKH4_9PROT|nr:DMT family transporter [Sulfurisoma sediminicola]RLJ68482.1 drug/metabolite transporter (DMT)-like permease [Sulfurisoma sediminicola]